MTAESYCLKYQAINSTDHYTQQKTEYGKLQLYLQTLLFLIISSVATLSIKNSADNRGNLTLLRISGANSWKKCQIRKQRNKLKAVTAKIVYITGKSTYLVNGFKVQYFN